MVLLALASAFLVRLARPQMGLPLVGLSAGVLLLGFGIVGAVRANYTYDDSNKEILVYAQGSADLRRTYQTLDAQVFRRSPPPGSAVEVDYDLWFPFNWYVRRQLQAGAMGFFCFKDKGEEGWN